MAATPTLDARSVAVLSDAEIDAFLCRIAEIVARLSPQAVDDFCSQIEELLDRAELTRIKP